MCQQQLKRNGSISKGEIRRGRCVCVHGLWAGVVYHEDVGLLTPLCIVVKPVEARAA